MKMPIPITHLPRPQWDRDATTAILLYGGSVLVSACLLTFIYLIFR